MESSTVSNETSAIPTRYYPFSSTKPELDSLRFRYQSFIDGNKPMTNEIRVMLKSEDKAEATDLLFHVLCNYSSFNINHIKKLLQFVADLESELFPGETMFILAVRLHHFDAVKLLVKSGANLGHIDLTGGNAIIVASDSRYSRNQIRILKYLLDFPISRKSLNHRDKFGENALMKAVKHLNVYAVRLLLVHGATVIDEYDYDKCVDLMSAYAFTKLLRCSTELRASKTIHNDDNKMTTRVLASQSYYHGYWFFLMNSFYFRNDPLEFIWRIICQRKNEEERRGFLNRTKPVETTEHEPDQLRTFRRKSDTEMVEMMRMASIRR
jgi:hypothetical protein